MLKVKQLKLATIFGILLLIIGIGMFSYSIKVIEEQTLSTTEISLNQLWNYESSSEWWQNVFLTLILPLTSVFISIGGVTLTSKAILPVIQNKKNDVIERKRENP